MTCVQESLILNNHQDSETDGFDIQAGLSWIYPTNYPLRDYQFNIIQHALFRNTLVSLPTGLGKTFIAAVVMYNFYRWYPTGKIIFMAPTKPLVKQQVDACYEIMAIPKDVTAELTGAKASSTRNDIWMEKRVFFITPQILQNDIDKFLDLAPLIKCIVFDEAHKARGNHAYCEVIRKLKQRNKYFRVLALSATPGNNIDDVGEVIKNLLISHMEFKTEESPDVKPYVFQRKLDTIVIPLGDKLEEVKADYIEILEKYARTLIKYKIIYGNCSTLTKGRIFMAKKEFQERPVRDPNYNEIIKTLNICMTLYHAYELLIRVGLRGFLAFYEEHIDKPLLRGNSALIRIMEDVRDYLGPLPDVEILPDGTYPEVPLGVKFGHPKFYRLRDILLSHFTECEENSRVIVFFEYRDSVKEAFIALLQARPLIKAKIFLGQKSGITQRSQLHVIKMFREGECNTLLSTSIGEEGLDVGEVDLIVCFDISNKSPIRMIQRMGRTGRRRAGQVIVLVTEGKEQQTLNDCLYHKNNMKTWAGSTKIMERFFQSSPRMVPENIDPECVKMQITVKKPPITKKSTLKDMFKAISKSSSSSSILSQDVEIVEIKERLADPVSLFDKSLSQLFDLELNANFNRYIENQRSFQGTAKIQSSEASDLFVGLMKFADSKRFNIPTTQDYGKASHNKNLRQGNIKNMFMSANSKNDIMASQDDFMTQKPESDASSQSQTSQILQEAFKSDPITKALNLEISNYLTIELTTERKCRICENLFKCNVHKIVNDNKFLEDLKHWIPPDLNIIKNITPSDLEIYEKRVLDEHQDEDGTEHSTQNMIDNDYFTSLLPNQRKEDKSFHFNEPKSLATLLNSFNISSTYTSLKEAASTNICRESNVENLNDLFTFFKLDKIEDLFETSCNNCSSAFNDSQCTVICTGTGLNMTQNSFESGQLSPILNTQNCIEQGSPILNSKFKSKHSTVSSSRFRKSLEIIDTSIENTQKNSSSIVEQNLKNSEHELNQSKDDSEDETLLGIYGNRKRSKAQKKSQDHKEKLSLEDFCDLSAFGFSQNQTTENQREIVDQYYNPSDETLNRLVDNKDCTNHNVFDVSMKIDAESTRIENAIKDDLCDDNIKVTSTKSINDSIVLNVVSSTSNKNKILHNGTEIVDRYTLGNDSENFFDSSIICNADDKILTRVNNINASQICKASSYSKLGDVTSKIDDDRRCSDNKFESFCDSPSYKQNTLERNNMDDAHICREKTPEKLNKHCTTPTKNHNKNSDHNNIGIETIVIEDSPIKENIMDLTLSPTDFTSSNRKVLSQLSITQILSLAAKPTQASNFQPSPNRKPDKFNLKTKIRNNAETLHKQSSTNKMNRINGDILKFSESSPKRNPDIFNTNRKIIDNIRSTNITREPIMDCLKSIDSSLERKHDAINLENSKSNPQNLVSHSSKNKTEMDSSMSNSYIVPSLNQSLLDDLNNFEEFNEPFNGKAKKFSSPIFKAPSVSKLSLKRIENAQKYTTSSKSKASSSKSSTRSFSIDSDEEFETPLNVSFSGNKSIKISTNNSDDEFETTFVDRKKVEDKKQKEPKMRHKKTKKRCDFIEVEAEVSDDEVLISDDEMSEDGSFDESFVDDETQNLGNNTQMHINYLKSVRSPNLGAKFKIPSNLKPISADIFSQVVNTAEPDSYVNDSFCVNTQDVDHESHDLSELEILEKKLKENRRKRRKSKDSNEKKYKRRIIVVESDSD